MEKRVLIALVVSFLILLLWAKLFPPPKQEAQPAVPQTEAVETPQEAAPVPSQEPAPDTQPSEPEPGREEAAEVQLAPETVRPTLPVAEGMSGKTLKLSNGRVDLTLIAEGGSFDGFELARHEADEGTAVWLMPRQPFRVVVAGNEEVSRRLQREPYLLERTDSGAVMTYGDGTVWVRKRLVLEEDLLRFSVEVKSTKALEWGMAMGPTFRVLSESEAKSKFVQTAQYVSFDGGKLKQIQQAGLHVLLDDMGMVESIHACVIHWVVDDLFARINGEGRYGGPAA